ncbi:MAG TPA: tetratricopeptide repeat protein [Terriglobales bacterium]|nr:tetratricopeptide repeat protein [Terriglobales bacterium]
MGTERLNYQFGDFTLDVAKGCLIKAGQEVKLRPKVFEALKYLVENPGRLVSKKELIQAVWPDSFVTDDSLVQCTVELRRALDDHKQGLLKTVPRRGYLFTPNVLRQRVPAEEFEENFEGDETAGPPFTAARKKRFDVPHPRTTLIGREQQVAGAADLLLRRDVRLLTLVGPGGAGKTRLALAVAAAVSDHFTSGVQFVGLGAISNRDLVGSAIVKALDVQQPAGRTVAQVIAAELHDSGPFLLVLDNFEQLLPAATLVAELLETCPPLKILITSRACLRIYGEQEFPVAPLAQDSAIELFVQRAKAVRPSFAVTPENEMPIREICSKLDGLPLAIELAAARTRVLSPVTMLDRLQSRLQLLIGGARDLPERQQTLRSAIDWSHDLLNEAEQKLFRRISVFVGGCTLEAAEAVCNTHYDLDLDVFEGISSLIDKNLLQSFEVRGAEPRFIMLDTIREYALESLRCSGEEHKVLRAHAAYCLVLAEEGNPELNAIDRAAWLARCDSEIDNLRSSLDWLFQNRELEWGLRLSIALFRFWDMREHLTEGRARLETIVQLVGDDYPRERAQIWTFLGALTTSQGEFATAHGYLSQSLSLYEELGDKWGIGTALNALAVNARDLGDYATAQKIFEKSLAFWRAASDRVSTARGLHNLANVLRVRGDYSGAHSAAREATTIFEELGDHSGAAWSINLEGDISSEQGNITAARELYQRALSLFREAADRWGCARSLTDLGVIYSDRGDYSSALQAYAEALQIFVDLGHRRGLARTLEGYARLALAQGQPKRALKLAGAAAHLRSLVGAPLRHAEQEKLNEALAPAWNALGKPAGEEAWAEGAAMTFEKAIQYSLQQPQSFSSTHSGR